MPDLALALPARHSLVSLSERPELRRPMSAFTTPLWAEFLNQDEVANRLWHHLDEEFARFQLCLLDHAGRIVAAENAAPIAWDGTDGDLPAGWDAQLERSVAQAGAGIEPTSLGALQIVVAPDRRGEGLAGTMLEAMRANAAAHRLRKLIACVRPTLKEAYPLTPIARYAAWTRSDGLPFDPWMRIHARLGARIARPEPRSMTIRGTIAEWESWTGMTFPESGDYVIPHATSVLHVDHQADLGIHHDENVWMIHEAG